MDEATIETRVRRLEDIEAIRKLKALCCLHVDREDSEAFADLFVEDGAFIGAFQELRGREAIREIRFWPFMVHYVSNPIIDVNGDSAIGIWYFLRPYTAHDGRPHSASGIYQDEYRRTLDEQPSRLAAPAPSEPQCCTTLLGSGSAVACGMWEIGFFEPIHVQRIERDGQGRHRIVDMFRASGTDQWRMNALR